MGLSMERMLARCWAVGLDEGPGSDEAPVMLAGVARAGLSHGRERLPAVGKEVAGAGRSTDVGRGAIAPNWSGQVRPDRAGQLRHYISFTI